MAWLPSLDLNRPLQAFRSPGSIRPMPKRARSLCTTSTLHITSTLTYLFKSLYADLDIKMMFIQMYTHLGTK